MSDRPVSASHHARLDALFAEALELAESERHGFLARARRMEPQLHAELEELLRLAAAPLPALAPDALAAGPLWLAITAEMAPESPDPMLVPGARVGPWRLERELGRGGMGVVYFAERADGAFEQRAALKLLQPGRQSEELLRRFERERQILASLEHPNIARLLDGGQTVDARPYFAMEFVAGRPIDRYCDEERLSIVQRLDLFVQVGRALQHAHRNLVVHRDLKPSNIAVTDEGEVKLLDFGIARLLAPEVGDEALTLTGHVLTPRYASPELVLGQPVTTASDVYQMGLLLYELLTGEHAQPVGDSAPGSWIRAICEDSPARPSMAVERSPRASEAAAARRTTPAALVRELRGDLDSILLVALRKESDRRYGSAGELVDDLVRCRRRLPVRARPETVGYRAARFVERHRAAVGIAVGGLLALTVALVMVVGQRLQVERQAALARQMESTLGRLFAAAVPGPEQPTVRSFVDQGLHLVRSELAGQPDSQARLMTLLGRDYNALGLYTESATVLEEAMAFHAARANADDLDAAETLAWLAQAYHYSGRYPEALARTRRVLDLRRQLLGDSHADTVWAQLQLGDILHTVGRLPEAEAELRGGLAHLRHSGAAPRALGTCLRDLGNVLRDRGEAVDAERCFRESAALFENDDSERWRTEIYLSRLLIAEGRLDEAERLLQDDLDQVRRHYGGDHPIGGEALRELGHLRLAQGDYAEADARLAEAIALFHRFDSDEHPMIARIGALQCELALARGDAAGAKAAARDALARFERLGLAEHPAALDSRRTLGRALLELGEPQEAVALLDATLRVEQRLFVPGDRRMAITRAALATARHAVTAAGPPRPTR